MSLLIKNAQVLSAGQTGLTSTDVRIENGRIESIGACAEADRVIDGTGKVLIPALFDMHVHLREPGGEDRETIETGSDAAINGGITGILAMPNTTPPIDTGGMVTFIQNIAEKRARIPVSVAGCLTEKREGAQLAEIGDMVDCGAVMVTDCHHVLQDSYILRRALEYTKHFDVIVGVYPDTPALSRGGLMHEGTESFRLGLTGIPAAAEEISIEHDCRIAQFTGGRIHIQNVSTAGGVASIRRFKQEGVQVTAEVTPHHLLLNHSGLVNYDPNFKMMPPLRRQEDQDALLEGLKDGTIDVIATGHAPHTRFDKNLDFRHAPFGITGLDTALISLFDRLIAPGKLSWAELVEVFALAPRRMLKQELPEIAVGSPAALVLFDPEAETEVTREFLKSESINTPWIGQTLNGSVSLVVSGDDILKEST